MALPITNQDVLNNPEAAENHFFLLGKLEGEGAGFKITVSENDPIVVQDKPDYEAIVKDNPASGVFLRKNWDDPDARNAQAEKQGVSRDMRMIGAGGIVSVQVGNEEPQTVLFEKTAGPSRGRMAQASGLSDKNPLQTMWAEIAEETGILIIDEKAQKLSLVVIEPVEELDPAFKDVAEQEDFFNRMEQTKLDQIDVIKARLPESVRNWDIQTVRKQVSLSPEDVPYLDTVTVSLPGRPEVSTQAIVSDSMKTANVNLLRPVRLELPAGTKIICVDPEQFQPGEPGRPVQLFTRDQMLTRDFIDNKSSVPMRPFLENAMLMEMAQKIGHDSVEQNDPDTALEM